MLEKNNQNVLRKVRSVRSQSNLWRRALNTLQLHFGSFCEQAILYLCLLFKQAQIQDSAKRLFLR